MYNVDVAVIGAGVTGLGIALSLSSRKALDIAVIEKEPGPGRGVTSRSSEVIHAGIYYPGEFLKTRLCVQGARLLYEFCNRYGVRTKKTGKLIVASDDSGERSIEALCMQGVDNGVEGLRLFNGHEMKAVEPNVRGIAALYSPDSGIVDSHGIVKMLEAILSNNSVKIIYRSELKGLEKTDSGYVCRVKNPQEEYSFTSRIVINAAGLDADHIAGMAGMDIDRAHYRIHKVKGEYFRFKKNRLHLINGLVYPSPDRDMIGLGIHATKDIEGGVRFGPNAFYVDELDYNVDPSHRNEFYLGVVDYLPFVDMEDLMPDTSGIRPKIQAKGESVKDFIIRHEKGNNLPGLINLVGIESPGLTSLLAIGAFVCDTLNDDGLL